MASGFGAAFSEVSSRMRVCQEPARTVSRPQRSHAAAPRWNTGAEPAGRAVRQPRPQAAGQLEQAKIGLCECARAAIFVHSSCRVTTETTRNSLC